MNLLTILLDIAATCHEAFWMFRWMELFLEKKVWLRERKDEGKHVEWILTAIYAAITFVGNRRELTSAYTAIAVMIYCFIAVLFFWKANFVQTSAVVGGYFCSMFLIGNLVISLTGIIGGDELISKCTGQQGSVRFVYLLLNNAFWFVLNQKCINYLKHKNFKFGNIKVAAWVALAGFAGTSFIGMMLVNSFSIQMGVLSYIVFFLFLLTVFGSYYVIKQRVNNFNMTVLVVKNEMLEKNYQQFHEYYASNAKLYHDMNHHFEALYHLLQNNEEGQAKLYLENLRKTSGNQEVEVRSGINVLDAVFYEMERKAKEKGIVLEIEVPLLPCDLRITNSDICSLFANLLENAVEASEKKAVIRIKKIHQALLIVLENDYKIKPHRKGGKFITSKDDKISHGWGTQIIDQIVKKYEGSIEYHVKDGLFCVSIMLNEMEN